MDQKDGQSADDMAVQWFVRLRDEGATDDDRLRCAEWRRASPANENAWIEVRRLWEGLDQVDGNEAQHARSAGSSGLDTQTPVAARVATSSSGRTFGWRGIAAAAVLAGGIFVAWHIVPVGLFADYRAAIGSRQKVQLADGSSIELGTGAAIDVEFDPGQRVVRLLVGEAFFTVAKDVRRPFVVMAGKGRVEVLGTAFNVKIDNGVTVAVAHNAVGVSAAGSRPVHVSENQSVHFDGNGVTPPVGADLDTIQAWRDDQIIFRDAPLDQVLTELQRYRYGRIQLFGGDVGKKRVTAVFDTRRTDAALETIARSLNLRLLKATNLLVAIVPE